MKYNLRSRIKQVRNQRFNKENHKCTEYAKKDKKTEEDYVNAIYHLLLKIEKKEYCDRRQLQKNVVGLCMLQYENQH